MVPPIKTKPSHCFAINGDIFNPECIGIEEVIQKYEHAVKTCQFNGPTYFSEIINEINGRAEAMRITSS